MVAVSLVQDGLCQTIPNEINTYLHAILISNLAYVTYVTRRLDRKERNGGE